jgi:hypothetical protein
MSHDCTHRHRNQIDNCVQCYQERVDGKDSSVCYDTLYFMKQKTRIRLDLLNEDSELVEYTNQVHEYSSDGQSFRAFTLDYRLSHGCLETRKLLMDYLLLRENNTRKTLLTCSHLIDDLIDIVLTYALSCLANKTRTLNNL